MTTLKGITWDHPRAYEPLVACSEVWARQSGVQIVWDRRSLQRFESQPVRELARRYDLIVLDHPHIGQVAAEACLARLDAPESARALAQLTAGSLGGALDSYRWNGAQWALPIDLAAQVQAWRPDLLASPPEHWSAVLDLARTGRVALALKPPHSLMTFCTLAGNLGTPCHIEGETFIDGEAGAAVYARLSELAALVDAVCFRLDPIAVLDLMAGGRSNPACIPYVYGYVPYAREGFRRWRLRFADIPTIGSLGPVGSVLGGTGLAVSAGSSELASAMDFAYWLASGAVQASQYAENGGQPAHAEAWTSESVNRPVQEFYHDTLRTIAGAWVRPRHPGYMEFQMAASLLLNAALKARTAPASVLQKLNEAFRRSQQRQKSIALPSSFQVS
jgi:multiple sugar transport system substrate-binding protein